ncbi:MAG: hypothetical protein AB1349_04660 [Elusimicrobiota bacterium]
MTEKFDVGYNTKEKEKEITDWEGKTIKSAKVIHESADGCLIVEFSDGTKKEYNYNELGFWEK